MPALPAFFYLLKLLTLFIYFLLFTRGEEMKKHIIALLIISFIFDISAADKSVVDGKIGTSYAKDPEKFGLQLNFSYYRELDPYFALGIDPSFYWIRWRQRLDGITTESGIDGSKVKDTDAYMFPILGSAQIRLVNLKEKLHGVLPYFNIGLGYSPMLLTYENSSGKSKADFFGGFTWQLVFGASFSPAKESKIEFLADAGYRSAKLKNSDDIEIDMSGFVFNAGIRYPF